MDSITLLRRDYYPPTRKGGQLILFEAYASVDSLAGRSGWDKVEEARVLDLPHEHVPRSVWSVLALAVVVQGVTLSCWTDPS